MAQNYPEFRRLLKVAIGKGRKKTDFAQAADLSLSHLSRMLNAENMPRPSRSTLEKIADASEGRVNQDSLLDACGYSETEGHTTQNQAVRELDNPEAQEIIQDLKTKIRQFSGVATRYNTLEDVMETIAALCRKASFRIEIESGVQFKGRGRLNAEKVANATISWNTDEYACELGLAIFYCETTGGGVILSEVAFDLLSLIDTSHSLGTKKLLELSVLDGAVLSDYQTVFTYRKL